MMHKKPIWNDNPFDQWSEEELLCMEKESICYGKGGGSAPPPQPSSVSQTTTSEFPTELRPFVSDIFEKSQAVQEQRQAEGFQPELTQQLASFTPEQEQSFAQIQNLQGQTQPLFDEATALARQSGRSATDPAEIAALMNPFLRNVTDIQKREAERVGDVQEQQLAAQAAQAGAFGGSRAAILEAERQRNLNQQLGDIEAQGLAASFQNAQSQLQNQFGREAGSAAQLGALGSAIPAQQLKEIGALSGIGAARQQQSQRALDIATQQAREEFGFPMATLQDFSSILRGFPLPATQNVSRQSFSPAQPLSTQLLGLGTGLAGLAGAAGAFKKAGGLVGAPVRMQNGGYVKLAGGGGLGQMMQEKLPSNRVRIGKTAYADGDQKSELETLLRSAIGKPASEKKAILEEALKRFPNQEAFIRQGAAAIRAENLLPLPSPPVTGETATSAIEAASVNDASPIPVPRGFRPQSDLSTFQNLMGGLDKAVTGVDAGLESFMTRGGEKLGGGDVRRMDPTGMLSVNRIPASSPLLSAPQGMMAEEIVASGPQGMMAEEIVTSPAGPSISGLNPRTGAPPLPSLISGGLPQDDEPLRGPSISGLNPRTGVPEPFTPITGGLPEEAGAGQMYGETGRLLKGLPDQKQYTAPVGKSIADRFLGTKFGSDVGSIFEGESRDDFIRRISQPNRALLSAGDVVSKVGSYFGDSPKEFEKGQRERELKLAQKQAGIEAGIEAGGADPLSSVRDPKNIATAIDPDPVALLPDLNIGDALGGSAPLLSEKLTTAAPTDPNANNIDTDIQQNPDLSSSQGMTQNSYSKLLKDFREGQNKDYAADVEKAMGPAPTYEKGEEPDFAARKWLTLANFGARLASAGGDRTLVQAIGDAAQPALKELGVIGKEERKIKRELRTERNAQKRMKYQDKLQRFDLKRKLRSDDLDSIKAFADIKLKQERNDISKEDASVRRVQAMSTKAMTDTKIAILDLNATMDAKGQVFIKDVMAKLDDLRKISMKSSVSNSMYGVDAKTATSAYQAQLPSIYQQFRGRVLKDGVIMNDGELASLLKVGPTTQPRTTVSVPGSKATITIGNVSK